MTDTKVTELIINTLTKEKYNELNTAGSIIDTELYMITDDDELVTVSDLQENYYTKDEIDAIVKKLKSGAITATVGYRVYSAGSTTDYNDYTTLEELEASGSSFNAYKTYVAIPNIQGSTSGEITGEDEYIACGSTIDVIPGETLSTTETTFHPASSVYLKRLGTIVPDSLTTDGTILVEYQVQKVTTP